MKTVKKAIPLVLLVVLAVLTGAADIFKQAANVSLWETAKAAVIALEPFAQHVLIAGIVAYLAYWRFASAKAHVASWSQKVAAHPGVTPRVTEVTQSAFPLLYWLLTAVLCAYALDSSIFLYTGAVLVGIGYLFKSEVNHCAAGIIMQLTAKVKVGDTIAYDTVQGKLIEIGLLYSVIEVADGSLRVNNYDLWSKGIKVVSPSAPAAIAEVEPT